jgi:2-oxoglutarate ferredoxin oxidoreductase subunit alpha
MAVSFMEGNEAVAWGALAAGCRFFAGYPITPATTIYNAMLELLPPRGGVCLQGEDEIASIGSCLGASMAGWKAMTATSGPGISLYSEQISFAVGSEIPLVIVDVQRLGPSTGSATKGADGDVQFLRWGNSGGLPVIVLAPVDVADCFTLTVEAFNLAERFRCPVFLATNKEIAMTRESVDLDALPRPPVVERAAADPRLPFLPFAVEPGERVPRFLPMGGPLPVRQTSSTHGADGFITTDPAVIEAFQRRLLGKIEDQVETFSFFEASGMTAPETVVITYGVTARAAREAVRRLQEDGRRVGLLVLKTLWPVPAALIREKIGPCRRVLVVEMNLGQYVHEIRRVLPAAEVGFLGQMNGNLITPGQIRDALGEQNSKPETRNPK